MPPAASEIHRHQNASVPAAACGASEKQRHRTASEEPRIHAWAFLPAAIAHPHVPVGAHDSRARLAEKLGIFSSFRKLARAARGARFVPRRIGAE